jgi:hypothetical protein
MSPNSNPSRDRSRRQFVKCPSCGKKVEYTGSSEGTSFPFCSERCQMVDLDKWFDGEYVLSRDMDVDDLDRLTDEQRRQLFGDGE